MRMKTNPYKIKDFYSLVKMFYKTKGIRPLSKAMAEASLLWKKRGGLKKDIH